MGDGRVANYLVEFNQVHPVRYPYLPDLPGCADEIAAPGRHRKKPFVEERLTDSCGQRTDL